jgi:SAM-dependent methyltransferase
MLRTKRKNLNLRGSMTINTDGDYAVDHWLDEKQISELAFSEFWNNEEKEKSKEWYVLDGNFKKMENYIQERGLPDQLRIALEHLDSRGLALHGVGMDIAAGNLWAVPYLLTNPKIEELFCLEYSKHRLLKLGKAVLKHYNVSKEKIKLVLGSFYEIRMPDHSLDFVFMSQAFHHADKPKQLLSELKRVLKPNGIAILIGEDYLDLKSFRAKHFIKWPLARLPGFLQNKLFGKTFAAKPFFPSLENLKIPDPEQGDHMYFPNEYRQIFESSGFDVWSRRYGKESMVFVLTNSRGANWN